MDGCFSINKWSVGLNIGSTLWGGSYFVPEDENEEEEKFTDVCWTFDNFVVFVRY